MFWRGAPGGMRHHIPQQRVARASGTEAQEGVLLLTLSLILRTNGQPRLASKSRRQAASSHAKQDRNFLVYKRTLVGTSVDGSLEDVDARVGGRVG